MLDIFCYFLFCMNILVTTKILPTYQLLSLSHFFLPINSSHEKRILPFQIDKEEIEEDSTTQFISNEKPKK
jgi:hypothetical protein